MSVCACASLCGYVCVRVCVFKCVSENEYVIASVTMRLQMRVSKYKINLLVVVCVSMCW